MTPKNAKLNQVAKTLHGIRLNFTKEIRIENIKPNETKEIIFKIKTGMDIPTTELPFIIKIDEWNGFNPAPITYKIHTQSYIPPKFKIIETVINDGPGENSFGNSNAIIEKNETIETSVVIQNIGQGVAENTVAEISIDNDNIFFAGDKKIYLDEIQSNEHKVINFSFSVNSKYSAKSTLPITVKITEKHNKFGINQNLGLEILKKQIFATNLEAIGKYHIEKPIDKLNLFSSEISKDIPKNKEIKQNSFAVVIGNKNYTNTKSVDYALNDSRLIREYLINTFGYKEGNIFYIENGTKGEFETLFGTDKNPKGKLFNSVKKNKSDIFIYYTGHGAPGLNDKKGYFVPIECDPQYVEIGGYSLDTFYKNLLDLKAKSLTIVLDACFSGVSIYDNISPMVVNIENPISLKKNSIIFTSSSKNEVSCWYNEKKHGMFTYYFLKGIHDKNADYNNDNQLTAKELFEFISNSDNGVPYYARKLHGIEQNPSLKGKNKNKTLINYH